MRVASLSSSQSELRPLPGWAHGPLWLLAGALLAELGWGTGRHPAVMCLVPVMWALAGNASSAFALMFGYTLATTRSLAEGAGQFAQSPAEALGLVVGWLAIGAAGAAVWAVAHRGFRRSISCGVCSGVLAQLLLLFPPLWLLSVGMPISGVGFILDGSGWYGLAAGLVVPVAVGGVLRRSWPGPARSAVVVLAVLLASLVRYEPSSLREAPGVYAFETRWGDSGQSGQDHVIDRLPRIADAIQSADSASRTLVFPEAILGGVLRPESLPVRLEIGQSAKVKAVQVLVGLDDATAEPKRVGALVVQADGAVWWMAARQPMPVGLWRPWSASGYDADWSRTSHLVLPDGRVAYLSFCFEDVVPGFFLLGLLQHQPDVAISMANNWWMRSDEGIQRQGRAIEGMARLFGVALVRAVNKPIPAAR